MTDSVVLPVLTGDNYENWQMRIMAVLEAKNLQAVVYGAEFAPTAEEIARASSPKTESNGPVVEAAKKKIEEFRAKDASARMYLMSSLSERYTKIIRPYKDSARAIWSAIKKEHEDQDPVTVDALLHEFHSFKMDPKSTISEYIGAVESMVVKLSEAGKPQEEQSVVARLCAGLPSKYSSVVKAWHMIPATFKTKALLIKNLKMEEREMKTANNGSEVVAMKAEAKDNSNKGKGEWIKQAECYFCHKKGHVKSQCRARKNKKASTGGSGGPGGPGVKNYAVVANAYQGNGDKWILDSGASFHMSGNRAWFENYKEHDEKIPIQVGNHDYLYSLGTGMIRMVSKVGDESIPITIKDAHYVPGISENLFSQGSADAKGIKCVAEKGRIRLISEGKTIIIGEKGQGNLYFLRLSPQISANIAKAERTIEEWHRVLGHPDINELKNLAKLESVTDLKIVEKSKGDGCPDCGSGKGHRVSHPTSERPRATKVLERIHADLVGPMKESITGSKYFMLIKDEYSTYISVYFLDSKIAEPALRKYINVASARTQGTVKFLRTDNGGEFTGTAVKQLCDAEGVTQEFSCPHTPEQNGEVERANRTIIESARTMLEATNLPDDLWEEAIQTAVYLRNRITNKRTRDRTPFELFFGRAPVYSHLVEFGRECQVLNHKYPQSKFSSRTLNAYAVGYGERINTYRCFVPERKCVICTSDVMFVGHKTNEMRTQQIAVPINTLVVPSGGQNGVSCAHENNGDRAAVQSETCEKQNGDDQIQAQVLQLNGRHELRAEQRDQRREDAAQADRVTINLPNEDAERNNDKVHLDFPELPRTNGECSLRQTPLVHWTNTEVLNRTFDISRAANSPVIALNETGGPARGSTGVIRGQALARTPVLAQPMSFRRPTNNVVPSAPPAVAAPEVPIRRESLSVTDRLAPSFCGWSLSKDRARRSIKPPARNLMASSVMQMMQEPKSYSEALEGPNAKKWMEAVENELLAHYTNETWTLVKKTGREKEISCRWVFKIKQNPDGSIDRFKARLVARGFTQREGEDFNEIFSPVVRMDSVRLLFSVCAQFNLKYRQFDITTAFLYGEISEELYMKPPEGLEVEDGFTCKLNKSLYGLRQAPRCWNEKFSKMLKEFNMNPTQSDPCVYVSNDKRLYLALYVDDGLIFSEDEREINRLLNYLQANFQIKTIDSNCFIGVEIDKLADGSLKLHQKGYILKMLEMYKMNDCKPVKTPLETGHDLNQPLVLDGPIINDVPYAAAIGSLLYCAVATRPDLAYALSVLSKFTDSPRKEHWKAVKRVFRYLKGTSGVGLIYKAVKEPRLICYSDADWAGDHETRRSTTGLITSLATGPITFKSQKQKAVAISTTEAELMASTPAVVDMIWIDRFLKELGRDTGLKPKLLIDNQSAIKLIKNPEFHPRTKHIDIRYYFAREKYEEKLFDIEFVRSEDQRADVFTKPLTVAKFKEMCDSIFCFEPP